MVLAPSPSSRMRRGTLAFAPASCSVPSAMAIAPAPLRTVRRTRAGMGASSEEVTARSVNRKESFLLDTKSSVDRNFRQWVEPGNKPDLLGQRQACRGAGRLDAFGAWAGWGEGDRAVGHAATGHAVTLCRYWHPGRVSEYG